MDPSEVHVAVVSQNAEIASDLRPCAIANALADGGYAVSLVAPTSRLDRPSAIVGGAVELHLFERPTPAVGPARQVREQAQAALRAARTLAAIASRSPIDVLHVGNPPDNGWLFLALLRVVQGFAPAFVYDQHDPAPLLAAEKFGCRPIIRVVEKALSALEAASFRFADFVVFANEPFLRRARDLGRLRTAAAVVPNGWSLPQVAERRSLPWRDPSVPLVAYVGTTNTQDCVGHLIEALASVSLPFQAVICGDGDARNDAEELAQRLGVADGVVWLGWITERDLIAQVVAEAAVCIAPETRSPTNDITSFVKVIEYMSAGAAIAAHRLRQTETLAGDALEYADDDSPAALAAAIQRLLTDPGRRAARAEAAADRFAETLRWESIGARRLLEGYAIALADALPAIGTQADGKET